MLSCGRMILSLPARSAPNADEASADQEDKGKDLPEQILRQPESNRFLLYFPSLQLPVSGVTRPMQPS